MPGDSGIVACWGVEDADEALGRLLETGATGHGGVQDVGGGSQVATVLDLVGNVFGIREDLHFFRGTP